MDYGNVSYTQLTHVGGGGPVLNIRNTKDRFEIFMNGIEFISNNDKIYLLDLVKDFVPQYQKLNPYAMALGFLACGEGGVIEKRALIDANTIRLKQLNYDQKPLSEILSEADILRYARLYRKLNAKRIDRNEPLFRAAPDNSDCDQELTWYGDEDEEGGGDYYDGEYGDEYGEEEY